MADDNDDKREPTDDERLAMSWWNGSTDAQRQALMQDAREVLGYNPSVADVWNLRVAGDIDGPPLPPGARPTAAPPPLTRHVTAAEWRKRLRAAVRPISDEEERFVQWMAGWGSSTAETFLAILDRVRGDVDERADEGAREHHVASGVAERTPSIVKQLADDAARCKDAGVPFNPRLPPRFDSTPNDERPASHRRWWGQPYIVTYTVDTWTKWATDGGREWSDAERAKWMEAWPLGIRYDVRCLDGGAWDRSTNKGSFATLDEALACAKTSTRS